MAIKELTPEQMEAAMARGERIELELYDCGPGCRRPWLYRGGGEFGQQSGNCQRCLYAERGHHSTCGAECVACDRQRCERGWMTSWRERYPIGRIAQRWHASCCRPVTAATQAAASVAAGQAPDHRQRDAGAQRRHAAAGPAGDLDDHLGREPRVAGGIERDHFDGDGQGSVVSFSNRGRIPATSGSATGHRATA